MSRQRRICLVGATGLVGRTLIEQAVDRADVRIIGVARREMKLPEGARMEMLLADPAHWEGAIAAANARVLVCALGTTKKKAGEDDAAFRAVDFDLVVASAKAAQAAGIQHMIVVSSVGADPMAKSFYLKTKGEMEEALGRLRFRRLDIVRPSLMKGRRVDDPRLLERLGMIASPLIDLFLVGERRKYHSVEVDTLAHAIFALAREKAGGHFIHEYDAFFRAIRRAGG